MHMSNTEKGNIKIKQLCYCTYESFIRMFTGHSKVNQFAFLWVGQLIGMFLVYFLQALWAPFDVVNLGWKKTLGHYQEWDGFDQENTRNSEAQLSFLCRLNISRIRPAMCLCRCKWLLGASQWNVHKCRHWQFCWADITAQCLQVCHTQEDTRCGHVQNWARQWRNWALSSFLSVGGRWLFVQSTAVVLNWLTMDFTFWQKSTRVLVTNFTGENKCIRRCTCQCFPLKSA